MTEMTKPSPLNTFRNVLLMFFRAMVGAYGLNIVLYTIGLLLIGERWIVIEFMNTFAQVLWLPTFILVPICLLMREWRLVAMMIPGLVGFVFVWGDMFIPNPRVVSQETDIPIRLLTYNMYAGNSEVDSYINAIREIDADVVALQELHYPQAEILQEAFAEVYPYMAFHPGGTWGQGIMSRYPILDDTYWQYDFLRAALGHQRVELEINPETSILIYNVHPSHPGMQGQIFDPEFRSQEIVDLLERTSAETLPVIMLGDFNMPDFSDDYRAIHGNFNDAFRDASFGLGWTFPIVNQSHTAFLRLDYIFYSEGFVAKDASEWSELTGSDHLAIYADLLLRPNDH